MTTDFESGRQGDGENSAEIIKQLQELRGTRGHEARRRHKRSAWNVVLTLELREARQGPVAGRSVEVTTHDISLGGYSFVFKQFIREGTSVRACFELLPNKPILTGVVRSCILLGGTQHRIGVQFQKR